jgi:hypothetical protein
MSSTAPRPLSFGRGSVATKNRLTLSDSLTFDEWLAIGEKLAGLVDASAWWLGDWLFFGQWQYGKKYIAGRRGHRPRREDAPQLRERRRPLRLVTPA